MFWSIVGALLFVFVGIPLTLTLVFGLVVGVINLVETAMEKENRKYLISTIVIVFSVALIVLIAAQF